MSRRVSLAFPALAATADLMNIGWRMPPARGKSDSASDDLHPDFGFQEIGACLQERVSFWDLLDPLIRADVVDIGGRFSWLSENTTVPW